MKHWGVRHPEGEWENLSSREIPRGAGIVGADKDYNAVPHQVMDQKLGGRRSKRRPWYKVSRAKGGHS